MRNGGFLGTLCEKISVQQKMHTLQCGLAVITCTPIGPTRWMVASLIHCGHARLPNWEVHFSGRPSWLVPLQGKRLPRAWWWRWKNRLFSEIDAIFNNENSRKTVSLPIVFSKKMWNHYENCVKKYSKKLLNCWKHVSMLYLKIKSSKPGSGVFVYIIRGKWHNLGANVGI